MISIWIFGALHASLPNKDLQGNYFYKVFPTGAGDLICLAGFLSLMQEILHAWRESGRNGVLAGDSLSMRESWKPCRSWRKKCNFQTQFVPLPGFCQHFTENRFFISNKILTTIMSIPPTFLLFVYDKILAIIMSIPPTFPVLMNLPKLL